MENASNEVTELPQRKTRHFPVRLLTGYWPLNGGEKIPAGTYAELPADEAKSLVKSGLAARNDAL